MTSLHQSVAASTKSRLSEIAIAICASIADAVNKAWEQGETNVVRTACADPDIKELPVALDDGRLIVFHQILTEINRRHYKATFETKEAGTYTLHIQWVYTLPEQDRAIKSAELDKFRI